MTDVLAPDDASIILSKLIEELTGLGFNAGPVAVMLMDQHIMGVPGTLSATPLANWFEHRVPGWYLWMGATQITMCGPKGATTGMFLPLLRLPLCAQRFNARFNDGYFPELNVLHDWKDDE